MTTQMTIAWHIHQVGFGDERRGREYLAMSLFGMTCSDFDSYRATCNYDGVRNNIEYVVEQNWILFSYHRNIGNRLNRNNHFLCDQLGFDQSVYWIHKHEGSVVSWNKIAYFYWLHEKVVWAYLTVCKLYLNIFFSFNGACNYKIDEIGEWTGWNLLFNQVISIYLPPDASCNSIFCFNFGSLCT